MKDKDAEKPAEHPVDVHVSRVAGRMGRFEDEYAQHPGSAALARDGVDDMAQTARQEALGSDGCLAAARRGVRAMKLGRMSVKAPAGPARP